MIEMAHVEDIRKLLHVEEKSQRQVAKELGISRHTVAKYANQTDVPKYNRQQPYTPSVMTKEFQQQIVRLLAENETLPRKQRWIGHTIFKELQRAGFTGSEPTIRRHIAQHRKKQRKRAAFVPLAYEPGEVAEVDWGQAQVLLDGESVTVQILCFRLRWSHMPFVIAYPNQRQEAMFDGLQRAMTTLGGCPVRLTSDNMRQMVQKILEGKNRQEQDAYRQFRTYFLVDSNFCNPASGNEKGSVENLVGFAQRNIVGPRMEAHTWAELNEKLWQNCLAYGQRRLRGESLTVYERWQREQALLRPLPSRPFDCGRVFPVTSTGTACVQFETNRYSVPVQHAGRALFLRAYWDRVQIYAGADRLAEHPRCYEREQEVLDLDHYLDLLEQKPGALDQARPFRTATLPAIYHQFRAALRQRGPHGDREFIRLLMLHREFSQPAVEAAVAAALRSGGVHLEAVREHLLRQVRASSPPATYTDELEAIRVQQPPLRQYDGLLKGGAVH
jgi:transposase